MVTIYLAGPITNAEDNGRIWRNEIQMAHTGYDFYNPLAHIDATKEDVDPTQVVEQDRAAIRQSDAVLVGFTDVRMWGTPMEVEYAYQLDKPVALWVRDDTPIDDLPLWAEETTYPTKNRQEALDYLERHQ